MGGVAKDWHAAGASSLVPSDPALADIVGGPDLGWIVVGWFTPDYRPLAKKLATSLDAVGAPYRLWAKEKMDKGWNTKRKPCIVLEAMHTYPGKTLVLMDVDCIVRGDISPVTIQPGDVGLTVVGADIMASKRKRQRISIDCGSRVVMFRPTAKARAFALEWKRQVDASIHVNDEHAMGWAFLLSPDVAFSYIDPRYSGREISLDTTGVVICHDSAHEKSKGFGIREILKEIEKRCLRTGRTKDRKLRGELARMTALSHTPKPK